MSAKPWSCWALAAPFKKAFAAKAKVTNHFVIRLYQRFDLIERTKIFLDLSTLIQDRAYSAGFDVGTKTVLSLVSTKATVVVTKAASERLKLITIY